MAAYRDLQHRAAALGAGMVYQSQPAQWLVKAARAATGAPVLINVKGMAADDTPVLVSLAELERMQRAVAQVEALAVLMPDKVGIAADGGRTCAASTNA